MDWNRHIQTLDNRIISLEKEVQTLTDRTTALEMNVYTAHNHRDDILELLESNQNLIQTLTNRIISLENNAQFHSNRNTGEPPQRDT